jgi:hypothetical protein
MFNQNFISNFIVNFNSRAAQTVLLAAFVLVFAFKGFAAPGDLDASFGIGGRTSMPNAYGTINAVAVQPDGKIVAVGMSVGLDWLIMRFNADGSPDTSFSGDGWTRSELPVWNSATSRERFTSARTGKFWSPVRWLANLLLFWRVTTLTEHSIILLPASAIPREAASQCLIRTNFTSLTE